MVYDMDMNEQTAFHLLPTWKCFYACFNMGIDDCLFRFSARQPSDLRKHRRKVHAARLPSPDFECDIIKP